MTDLLTRAAILAAADLPTERVDVPEWGGAVLVRGLTAGGRDAMEGETLSGADGDQRARLVARCLVDEAGARLFTDADITALAAKSATAMDRVFDAACRLSGYGPAPVADAEGN